MAFPLIPLIIASVAGVLLLIAAVVVIVFLMWKMKKKNERVEFEGPNPFMLEQPVKSRRSEATVSYDNNGQAREPSGPVFGHSLREDMGQH